MNNRAVTNPTGTAAASTVRSLRRARTRSSSEPCQSLDATAPSLRHPGDLDSVSCGRGGSVLRVGHDHLPIGQGDMDSDHRSAVHRIDDGACENGVVHARTALWPNADSLRTDAEPGRGAYRQRVIAPTVNARLAHL